MAEKRTSVFENSLIWFGAGVSLAEILTGTYFAPLGFAKGTLAILIGHVIGCTMLFLSGLIGGKLRQSREERKYRILAFLKEKGVEIPLEEVEELAAGGVVARPHFARVMLRHGYVSTTEEAFARYLDTDEYQRIERWKAGSEECIDVIHRSGGKAVLAHPYQLGLSPQELERAVARLKDAGLDGIECYYPRHTHEMTEQYLGLAARYGLHVTGGSDFHGEAVHPDMPLAPTLLEIDWLLASH